MSDISLDDVAKLICLNPTYVSEVFKKKTGENFSEYLSDYRIGIAKELLQDIRYRIIDVSAMVGYKDSKYFSRLFKKKVGVNPTDYRNLYI
jgi:two-component system response regulator YesN